MMGNWKKRKMVKGTRASQTTGKQKGMVPTTLQRFVCRRNRSYKHPEYARIMATVGSRKVKK